MINLNDFQNLTKNSDDIWYSEQKASVSYPDENSQLTNAIDKNSFWYTHRNQCILAAIKGFPLEGAIFDIGGGNGVVSEALQENGEEVVLLEPKNDAVRNAKLRGIKHLICSSLEDLGSKKNTLDNIGLFDVLEHIEDDKKYLLQLHKSLKQNGKIIITVPAYNFLWSNQDETVGHFRRYSLSSLEKQLTDSGFEIDYKSYLFSILCLPLFLLRRLPYLLFKPEKNKVAVKENEHVIKNKLLHRLIISVLNIELKRITLKKSIPFGTSCFIIANKK